MPTFVFRGGGRNAGIVSFWNDESVSFWNDENSAILGTSAVEEAHDAEHVAVKATAEADALQEQVRTAQEMIARQVSLECPNDVI